MEQIFHHILTASISGSIVILAVLVLRPLLKRGPGKFLCLLWLLAFLRLMMPFEIPSPMSLQPAPALPMPQSAWEAEPPSEPEEAAPPSELPMISAAPAEAQEKAEAPEKAVAPRNLACLVSWSWAAVAGLFLVHSLISYLRLRLRVRDAILVRGVWESEHIDTAFILGFLRPRIYIPMGLSGHVRGYILAHEHTHLRRGDHWLKLLGYVALALHWFNPLVWAAYLLMSRDIELACDEHVVRNMTLEERKAYSSALLRCSANRPHLTCPVAFGEVSVKQRIRRVLHYRRPALWITALSLAALVFVSVCLMTGQEQKLPPEQEEILSRCEDALEELMGREGYLVRAHSQIDCEEIPSRNRTMTEEFRRYGENFSTTSSDAPARNGGMLWWNGDYAYYNGSAWIREKLADPGYLDADRALRDCSPVGKTVTETWAGEDGSLGFAAEWIPLGHEETCRGTFVFRFREDGTLDSVRRDYLHPTSDFAAEHWVTTLTVQEEEPAVTRQILEERAAESLTAEEYARQLDQALQNREIPSNSTEYDRDFALGYGTMGWNFLGQQWFLSFGARNAGSTSGDLYFELSRPAEDLAIQGTVTTAAAFSLEVLRDGLWYALDPGKTVSVPAQTVMAGTTLHLDWGEVYGALPAGYYRIGMDFTLTTDSGETDTRYCYAKFRLFPAEEEDPLAQCRQGIQNLLARDAYHIRLLIKGLSRTRNDLEETYFVEELRKAGDQRLLTRTYYLFEDDSVDQVFETLLRDGQVYHRKDGQWVPDGSTTPQEAVENMEFWPFAFRIYDSTVSRITRQGDCIRITSPYSGDEFTRSRMDFFFDAAGNLTGIDKYYVQGDQEPILDAQMRLEQENPDEILEKIPEIG